MAKCDTKRTLINSKHIHWVVGWYLHCDTSSLQWTQATHPTPATPTNYVGGRARGVGMYNTYHTNCVPEQIQISRQTFNECLIRVIVNRVRLSNNCDFNSSTYTK